MTKIILNTNETVIKQSAANHFVGIEGCGGRLYLTNQRLFFKTHVLNINDHELTIELDQIVRTEPCRTFLIVPNGLKLILKSGKTEQFVISKRNIWLKEINEQMQNKSQ